MKNARFESVRSLEQKEQSALQLLRNALSQGLDDEASIEYAAYAMGLEHLPLIGRVHARHFKIAGPV